MEKNHVDLPGKAVGRKGSRTGTGEYWNSWVGHCGKRRWWEESESGEVFSVQGKLQLKKAHEPGALCPLCEGLLS